MKLFIIDLWVPFPSSEYGGVIVVIANNTEEAFHIVSNHYGLDQYHPSDNLFNQRKDAVENAKVYDIYGDHTPGVIHSFLT